MKPIKISGRFSIALVLLLFIFQFCGDDPEKKCGCEIESDSLVSGSSLAYLNTVDNNFYLDFHLDEYTQHMLICNQDLLLPINLDIDAEVSYSGYIGKSCENNDTLKVIRLTSIDRVRGCGAPALTKFETIQGKLFKNNRSNNPYDYYISAYTDGVMWEWILFICNDSILDDMTIPEYPESINVEFTGDVKYIESVYYEFGGYEHMLITLDEIEEGG